ncbi:MAG: hypothetical protein RL553_720, partial [Planctomycetota bacterium]
VNIQQKMAQKAFEKAKSRSGSDFDKYLSFARGFPSLIHSCGLVQALSFAKSKSSKPGPHRCFIDDLKEILIVGDLISNNDDLVDCARKADQTKYLLLSRRALDAAVWLKRYSEALEPEKAENQ